MTLCSLCCLVHFNVDSIQTRELLDEVAPIHPVIPLRKRCGRFLCRVFPSLAHVFHVRLGVVWHGLGGQERALEV